MYKGPVLDKLDVIAKYRFNYCLENHRTPYIYITEKIFDCFMAGTVPIYAGCEKIDKYISKESYILLENFSSMESLHSYLKNMPEEEYEQYLREGQQALTTAFAKSYGVDAFVELVLQIVSDIGEESVLS